jgi:hypothetical protein
LRFDKKEMAIEMKKAFAAGKLWRLSMVAG